MKYIIITFLLILTSSCALAPRIPTNYKGADAGYVVLSMSASSNTEYSTYTFFIRDRSNTDTSKNPHAKGGFSFCQTNVFCGGKFDYDNDREQGVVIISSLPEGEYEIYNFEVFENQNAVQTHFSSKEPFSIPFKVTREKVTYLGNYQANVLKGRNLVGMKVNAGAMFAVANRLDKDMPIAREKTPNIPIEIDSYVPSADTLRNPFFVDQK